MMENPKKILIVQVNAIGDIVMSISAFRAIRKRFRNAKIALLCQDWAPRLLEHEDVADEFVCVRVPWTGAADRSPKSLVRLLKTLFMLQREHFDTGICLRGDPKTLLLMKIAGVKRLISYGEHNGLDVGKYLLDSVVPIQMKGDHVMDWGKGVARYLGCRSEDLDNCRFSPPNHRVEHVRDFLRENDINLEHHILVGINPGHRSKFTGWLTGRWKEIVKYLQNRDQVKVLVFGAPYERQHIEEIIAGSSALSVIEPLEYLPVFTGFSDLIVCVDSAMAHIAAFTETYSVVLFGPASPAVTRPRSDRAMIVMKDGLSCRPCKRKGCEINGSIEIGPCMEDIEVSDVIAAIESQWPHILKRERTK